MNFPDFVTHVLALSRTDEAKAFLLGMGLAVGVRVVRAGLRWFKRVDTEQT